MSFQIPATVPTHYKTKQGEVKQYSPATLKIYKQKLNFLARNGFDTVHDVMAKPYDIIPLIQQSDTSVKALYKQRVMLSAIMWVVPQEYSKQYNPYYELFRKSMEWDASDSPNQDKKSV